VAHVVDEQIEDDVLGKIGECVRKTEPPYFFGFSVLTVALKSAVSLAERLKKLYPASIICFGGVHPSADPEEVLSFPQVDVVIRGEGETPLIELYRCVKEGRDFTHIKNLSYRHKGRFVHNEIGPIEDLTRLPAFPYHHFTSKRYDLGFIMSSRGCPHNCIFCSNRVTTGRRYRFRPVEAVIGEIDMLYHKYQFRPIPFSYVPEGNTEQEIRRDILFSYFSHYLNIGRLKLIFAQTGPQSGWFNAGERLLEILKKIPALIALAFMLFVKLVQLFYYSVMKKETAISMRFFLGIFGGLWKGGNPGTSSERR